MYSEKVLCFGPQRESVGVLTEPRSYGAFSKTCVLFVNSGIISRVGVSRLQVDLARKLAGLSYLSYRFDLSGLGDSGTRVRATSEEGSALSCDRGEFMEGTTVPSLHVLDVKEVMDELSEYTGARDFVLYGLCSGADLGIEVALRDKRVSRLIQIDGYTYGNHKAKFKYFSSRIWKISAYKKLLARSIDGSLWRRQDSRAMGALDRVIPAKDKYIAKLEVLMQRNLGLCHIITGSDVNTQYERQFQDCFSQVDFGSNLKVCYLKKARHILSDLNHHTEVADIVLGWMGQKREKELGLA